MSTPHTPRAYTRTFLGIAAVSGVALLAAGMLALAEPEPGAHADDPGYGWGMHGDGPRDYAGHGWRGHDLGCGERTAGFVKHLDRTVPDLMDFNPTQQIAWNGLMNAADDAGAKLKTACGDRPGRDATAPERMARMESVLAARLDGLREVRPKFDAFYASLSDRQREGIDRILSHRGRPLGAPLGEGHPPVPAAPSKD
jgi:LTXXQ motif family protein